MSPSHPYPTASCLDLGSEAQLQDAESNKLKMALEVMIKVNTAGPNLVCQLHDKAWSYRDKKSCVKTDSK